MIVKSKEQPDFVVDRIHGTLLNTNTTKKEAYKTQRSLLIRAKKDSLRIADLENQLQMLIRLVRSKNDIQQ